MFADQHITAISTGLRWLRAGRWWRECGQGRWAMRREEKNERTRELVRTPSIIGRRQPTANREAAGRGRAQGLFRLGKPCQLFVQVPIVGLIE